jgi:exopolyphosphatase/guanosine-5'-triphosphate,3'-diphosphate pyrophosphatase
MKYASIDIGSNAVRLLFMQVFEDTPQTFYKKDALFRVPIRLGEDAFIRKEISPEKEESLLNTMIAFKHLIKAYQPVSFMACATSAIREAGNGRRVVDRIEKATDIKIEIIDGSREADIIYSNKIAETMSKEGQYLYIDVGGGSTELTILSKDGIADSNSYSIGTVRMLAEQVAASEWENMKSWLKAIRNKNESIYGIGSGGNINKIFNLTSRKVGKPISSKRLAAIYEQLSAYTYEERMRVFGLRPDRADVIIPATRIFLSVMKWAGIKKLYVPQIGLSDGIIHVLHEKYKEQTLNF